ncbi:MAG: phage holin family protein [Candidatus Pacebacteria bacterium]|nr:phage holin family protein [Candidatus Paceibacterota bacterium]
MLDRLIVRILTNAIAIYIASEVVSGFTLEEDSFMVLLSAGLIFGVINFFIKPIVKLISAPLMLLSLGLFTIIINIGMLFLLDYCVDAIQINGFWAAFWAMAVISAVNIFIGFFSKK